MPKFLSRRPILACAVISAFAVLYGASPPAAAQQPAIPGMLGGNERAPKPDLSAVQRLRFLTTMDFPPFNFLDASGRLSGFHVDLARALCDQLGLLPKCQIQALPWAELGRALGAGEGEAIIAGVSITAATRHDYAFTRPYLQFPGRFVTARASQIAEPLWKALAGKRVGAVKGSAHERMLRDYFKTATLVPYPDEAGMLGDLAAGKIDAVFADGMRLSFWLADGGVSDCCRFAGGPYIAPEYFGPGLAIAVPASKPELAEVLDGALAQLQAKGTFAELYLRYFPISFY